MQLCLLHLDGLHVDGRALRLWCFHNDVDDFRNTVAPSLKTKAGPLLTLMGSGDFHHISASLTGPSHLARIDTEAVYLTIDKDVLNPEFASKYYEGLKDQPLRGPDLQQAANINGATNLALMRALSQVMS